MGKLSGERRKKAKRAIIDYWGYCVWCGSREDLTLDHIIPISRGGTNAQDNLQCLCKSCNEWKGDFLEEELEDRVKGPSWVWKEEPPVDIVDPRLEGLIAALSAQQKEPCFHGSESEGGAP